MSFVPQIVSSAAFTTTSLPSFPPPVVSNTVTPPFISSPIPRPHRIFILPDNSPVPNHAPWFSALSIYVDEDLDAMVTLSSAQYTELLDALRPLAPRPPAPIVVPSPDTPRFTDPLTGNQQIIHLMFGHLQSWTFFVDPGYPIEFIERNASGIYRQDVGMPTTTLVSGLPGHRLSSAPVRLTFTVL
jgi:hypothetical protein